ncbi:GntR family transcriptional regulator [Starkeya sp. ORNL1]|nr:GntR family transcriptional regulator [Starkeya sp. ORNL1]
MPGEETFTRGDRIFRDLEFEIVSGRLPMGTKLGEEVLAARFGVSRGPLREALRRLEGGGLVVRLPHLGVRVTTLSPSDLAEIYEIREVLEGLAARLAAERMSTEERENLKKLLQQHLDLATHEGRIYPQAFGDEDIHYRIASGAGSYLLKRLLCGDLYSLIRLCRYRTTGPDQVPAFRDHVRIVDAIYDRDGEMAEILMRRHIVAARDRLLSSDIKWDQPPEHTELPMLRDLKEITERLRKSTTA